MAAPSYLTIWHELYSGGRYDLLYLDDGNKENGVERVELRQGCAVSTTSVAATSTKSGAGFCQFSHSKNLSLCAVQATNPSVPYNSAKVSCVQPDSQGGSVSPSTAPANDSPARPLPCISPLHLPVNPPDQEEIDKAEMASQRSTPPASPPSSEEQEEEERQTDPAQQTALHGENSLQQVNNPVQATVPSYSAHCGWVDFVAAAGYGLCGGAVH